MTAEKANILREFVGDFIKGGSFIVAARATGIPRSEFEEAVRSALAAALSTIESQGKEIERLRAAAMTIALANEAGIPVAVKVISEAIIEAKP